MALMQAALLTDHLQAADRSYADLRRPAACAVVGLCCRLSATASVRGRTAHTPACRHGPPPRRGYDCRPIPSPDDPPAEPRHTPPGGRTHAANSIRGLRPLPGSAPAAVRQAGKQGPPAPSLCQGVTLPLQDLVLIQPGLQFGCTATGVGLRPTLRCPLRTLDDPVLLRATRVVPDHVDAQADQPQRQGRRQIAPRTPRLAVVHTQLGRAIPSG